jgi:hypothetical protein
MQALVQQSALEALPDAGSNLAPMVVPSTGSTFLFVNIVLGLSALYPYAVWRATLRARQADARNAVSPRHAAFVAAAGMVALLTASAAFAESGALARAPNGLGVVTYFVVSNGIAIAIACSGLGRRLSQHLPIWGLVGFQAFRLPLELILHRWYEEGVIPVQMTYLGRNVDILSGALALAIAPLLYFEKLGQASVWFFNVMGSLLLLNVASIAIRSSPVPLRTYFNEPALLLALQAPYTWIVPVCVSGALLGHLLTFRSLWSGMQR